MSEKNRTNVRQEVFDYVSTHQSQEEIQIARSELRGYRLGRKPQTDWERQQVATVWAADKLLQRALSDTLSKNRRIQSRWRQG